jgi:molybdate transport system ATP-binding protein
VAIARALATLPRLLLMDEPLAALDTARKAEILPYLERVHRELSMPIVYVTHAMDEVTRLADHLVLLREGRVLAAGPLLSMLERTDLPIAQQEDAGVVLAATVAERDDRYGLARLSFDGGTLWVGAGGAALGSPVRARVLARDVSVAREAPSQTSIINVVPVVLETVHPEGATALLQLACAGPGRKAAQRARLLARITRRSCDALGLAPGDALHAQVKGVALMR